MQAPPGIEWKSLAGPLIWLLLAALAGAGLAWGGLVYQRQAAALKTQRTGEREALEKQHQENTRASQILEKYYKTFMELQQRAFIGKFEQQRLILGRHLAELKQQRIIANLDYKMSGRRAYPLEGLELPKDFEVYESTLELSLDLLHEGELLKFLTVLEGPAVPGLVSVDTCQLARAKTVTPEVSLHADCRALWYTVTVNRDTKTATP